MNGFFAEIICLFLMYEIYGFFERAKMVGEELKENLIDALKLLLANKAITEKEYSGQKQSLKKNLN